MFCENQKDTVEECKELLVLSGASRVHAETLFHLRMIFSCYSTPLLNEMRGGDLHGLSRAEIKKRFPQEYQKRATNKLHYRFPGVGGESYLDAMGGRRQSIHNIQAPVPAPVHEPVPMPRPYGRACAAQKRHFRRCPRRCCPSRRAVAVSSIALPASLRGHRALGEREELSARP